MTNEEKHKDAIDYMANLERKEGKLLIETSHKAAQEEYHTPSIEDIRVGYECEVLGSSGFETYNPDTGKYDKEVYHTYVFEAVFDEPGGTMLSLELWGIRTPYLTKEQIKAEEWKKSDHSWIIPDFEKSEEDEYINLFEKGEFRLYFNNQTRHVSIHRNDEPLFSGILPSINEFRFINKLLGI